MHQVRLSDELYQDAQRRAAEAGFPSVDDYVANLLQHDLHEERLTPAKGLRLRN